MSSNRVQYPAPAVWVAIASITVIGLAAVGSLDGMAPWLRAIIQAAGSVAGVACGFLLQKRSDELRGQGAVMAAVSNLLGLARGINLQIRHLGVARRNLADANHNRVVAQLHADTILQSEETALRNILLQVRAAVEAWRVIDQQAVLQAAESLSTNQEEPERSEDV